MGAEFTEPYPPQEQGAAFSSSGLPTQRFSSAEHEPPSQVSQRRNNAVALGLLLIGLLMLVGRIVGVADRPIAPVPPMPPMPPMPQMPGSPAGVAFTPGMILLTIASSILFFAFWRRLYGLMIPGALLTGLSIGVTFMPLAGPTAVLWGLALGFVAIFVLGHRLFNVRSPWPIFPAVPLFAAGLIVAIVQGSTFFAVTNSLVWLPLILIGAGLYLGWGRRTVA